VNLAREWVSVSDAAKARGVSVRTVKRWIENGEVETRKDGARRLVLLPVERDTEGTQEGHDAPSHVQKEDTKGTRSVNQHADREAELKEEIRFLRGVIEQLQRDGAETRAALRKALESGRPQLTSGTPNEVPETVPETPQKATASTYSKAQATPQKATECPKTSYGEGLTYGDIADELERLLDQRIDHA
jgi:hypothetical protein